MDGSPEGQADVLNAVVLAMRFRMAYEDVCTAYWGRPAGEFEQALMEAAHRRGVPVDETFAKRAAFELFAWE
ncbi:hypothetical protein ACIQZO_03630 [Streptomyces sp. NPDC097617]|uniref:hypothetical protein n=1 Tax=Streptomyces sp. NPDC097617 TaxID=3366091 RepID=UPI0038086FC2